MTRSIAHNYAGLWIACAAMAVLADVLFYRRPWGINAALFGLAVVIALLLRSPGVWKSWMGRIWVLLTAISLLALVEEPSPLAVLMAVVTLGTLALAAQRNLGDRITAWAWQWFHLLLTLFLRLLLDNAIVARWLVRHPQAMRRVGALATSVAWWFFPAVAGGIFIALFAVANPIIADWGYRFFEKLLTLFDWLPFYLTPPRFFLWTGVALGVYGLLRYRRDRGPRRHPAPAPPIDVTAVTRWWNGTDMIIRCLLVFNAVFALQTSLDLLYLYGGAALPPGMTYAHYAHRGAYPLMFTAILAGLFVLAAFRRGGAAERSPWARRLVYLWILQNLFLLASTVWRIWLYVDVYSLSRLRVAAMIWVLLVALGFCWIVAKITARKDNTWLWRMNTLTLFAVLFLGAFINFDGLIARFNVRHCKEITGRGVPIDLAYLQELGTDSLPALHWLRSRPNIDRGAVDQTIAALTTELRDTLSDWRGWTFRRWREAPADLHRPRVASERLPEIP